VLVRLRRAVQELTNRHREIEQVILFGSLARGDAVPGSDVDLLLVLQESDLPFLERSVYYQPAGVGLGVDLFVYTRSELEAMLRAGNTFVAHALREGIALFQPVRYSSVTPAALMHEEAADYQNEDG
jgi:predicted nucleotidyltransferase